MPAINLFPPNIPNQYAEYTVHDIKLGAAYGDVDGPEVPGFFTLDLSLDCTARIDYAHVEIGPKHNEIKLPGCMSYVAQNMGSHQGISLAFADYSTDEIMGRINGLAPDRRKPFLDAATAQSNLKRSLGITDTRMACMALLLAQIVHDGRMDDKAASTMLGKNFGLDEVESARIIQAAADYQRREVVRTGRRLH